MTILLVLGVVLVVFGGLVLLLFPDRPGGKLGWQGFEVSSVGAGLPVIVVGIVAVGFAALHGNGSRVHSGRPTALAAKSDSSSATSTGCPGNVFNGIPSSRRVRLEVGADSTKVVYPPESTRGPVGLRLTDGGTTIGRVVFSYVASSNLFSLSRIVDAGCTPVPLSQLTDITTPGQNPYKPVSYDTLRIRLGRKLYSLTLGNDASASALEATFTGGTS